MFVVLAIVSIIILACISFGQFINRFGVPALITFLFLGVITGSLPFEHSVIEPHFVENIGEVALIFIMFYGGFGTNWKTARTIITRAALLATVGACITAGAVTLFAHLILKLSWAEAFLLGAVICCTDGASVFSLLRTKKMNLRYNTVSVLEIENGSNDPVAYLLTLVALLIIQGGSLSEIPLLVIEEIVFGVGIGIGIALIAVPLIKRFSRFFSEGMDFVFIFAIAILTFALAQLIKGNGYLACFLCGLWLGNSSIPNKVHLARFFDSIDWFAQIMIFFVLGMLVIPGNLVPAILPAVGLTLFLLFIARPLAVFSIFKPRGGPTKQCLLVSWVGLRGAASLVFALMAASEDIVTQSDIFSIVVLTAFFSIVLQGTLLEQAARRFDMVDTETDVMMSFNDYQAQSDQAFLKLWIDPDPSLVGRAVRDIGLGQESHIVLIKRGEHTIAPNGSTIIHAGDILVITGESYTDNDNALVTQLTIDANSDWADMLVKDLQLKEKTLIVNILKEDGVSVTPRGWTKIHPGDTITLLTWE